jgi:lysozyme
VMTHKRRKIKFVKRVTNRKKKSFEVWFGIGLFGFVFAMLYLWWNYSQKVHERKQLIASIPKGFTSFGIDVSHHQGTINWQKLFAEEGYDTLIQFVYCKATEGCDHTDTRWKINRIELNKLNIPNGAYHFFSPHKDPYEQAEHFLNHWDKTERDLPPVLDVESEATTDKELISNMKIWLQTVELKTGMRPIIYTSAHFFGTKFQAFFPEYNFWIASYGNRTSFINDERVIHWQYCETGKLPGIEQHVDFNVSKIRIN